MLGELINNNNSNTIILITRVCPAYCRGILNKYHGTRINHEVKNNKNGGMCRTA